MVDIDDYINKLHKEISHLQNLIISYKNEVRTLRAEYAQMKNERDVALEMKRNEDSTITE
jgi:peptidoglycan hydrolase CwlO-like protein